MRKLLSMLFVSIFLACCSSDQTNFTTGIYKCENCTYQELNFKPDGSLTLMADGVSMGATYKVEDKQVTVDMETATYTFTILNANELRGEGDIEGNYRIKP